ncbi:MAG: NAD-binding protein [Christensenellales bacterium]
MKITITGGHSEADFIISMFKKEKHHLVVINDDLDFAKKISESNGINVYYGDPAKPHILEDAGVENSDILISLCDEDTDNYVICMLCKKIFNVKKCICIVKNPKNVDIF